MLRLLCCASAIFVLVISMCLLPQTAAARRCPVKEPETLLSLYQNSDAIYVATYEKLVEGTATEETEDYTVVPISKHFTVSSTLKGQSRKFVVIEDQEYRYKDTTSFEAEVPADTEANAEESAAEEASSEDADEESAESAEFVIEDPSELKSGDTLLLFVTSSGEEQKIELTDYRDGVKKLPMENIGVYEARIRELNSIFSEKVLSGTRLIEWLIRCAEDPVTRWEGTYELLQSVQTAGWRKQLAERRKERIASGEAVEEVQPEIGAEDEEGPVQKRKFDRALFADLLDHNHKQTLANILLNSYTASSSDKKFELAHGDTELIELVKGWGDPRLVGFLLEQLRVERENSWFNVSMMQTVANILDDDEAEEIASKYSDSASEDDDEIVEAEETEAETAEPATEAEAPEGPEAPAEAPPAEAGPDAAPAEQTEEPAAAKITYKQLRTELLQKFISRCELVIAEGPAVKTISER